MGDIVGNVVHACLVGLEVFNLLSLRHASMNIVFPYFIPEFKLVDVLLDLSDFLALCLKHRSRTLLHGFDSPHHDVVQVLGLTHHRISNIVDMLSNIGSFSSNVRNITCITPTRASTCMKFRGAGSISDMLYENIVMIGPEQWPIWIGPACATL